MIRLALIGAGRIGQVHALAVHNVPNASITAVVDTYPESAKALAAKLGAKVMELDEVFASNEIDAYIIASSTDTHSPLLKLCASVGKPVFCEKPIDLDYARAEECSDVIATAGITCMLGFNRRFDPQFAQLKAAVENGKVGQLETLIITSRDPAPPPVSYIKVSGGLFRDMMIHDFDMARWILGEEPTRIYATGSVMVDSEIGEAGDVDTASVTMNTGSGAIAVITNSRRASYGYDQRVEAFGEKGMLQVNNTLENNLVMSDTNGVSAAKPEHFFLERYADAYRIELTHFVESLQNGTKPSTDEKDGLAALRLADAAYESWKTGLPVDLT